MIELAFNQHWAQHMMSFSKRKNSCVRAFSSSHVKYIFGQNKEHCSKNITKNVSQPVIYHYHLFYTKLQYSVPLPSIVTPVKVFVLIIFILYSHFSLICPSLSQNNYSSQKSLSYALSSLKISLSLSLSLSLYLISPRGLLTLTFPVVAYLAQGDEEVVVGG